MTSTITTNQRSDEISWMSDEQYIAYQRGMDGQLIDRYYSRDHTPPGMTPIPSALAALEPPF